MKETREEIMKLFLSMKTMSHNLATPSRQWIGRGIAGFDERLKDIKWNHLDAEHGLNLVMAFRIALDSEAITISKTEDILDQIESKMKKLKELENDG